MKFTKISLWIMLCIGSILGITAFLFGSTAKNMLPISIGIFAAAIPLQLVLYYQTRDHKQKLIVGPFMVILLICLGVFFYTLTKDLSHCALLIGVSMAVTSYAAMISLMLNKALNLQDRL